MVMDGSSELEKRVAEAVQVLNHDMNACSRVAANQWLLQFQNSHAAWEVATSLLTSATSPPNFNVEAHFFAAQILRRKIKSEGLYLRSEDKTVLLNALLLAAQRFSTGPSQLLTQICLAISSLMLKIDENELKLTMEHLFINLKKLECQENGCIAVLELLTVLPEEFTDDSVKTKSCFKSELLLYTQTVMEFLLNQSEQRTNDGIKFHERNKKILRCLLSWVRADCFSDIQPASLAQHPLLNFAFNSLNVSIAFDVAIDIMTDLISRYEGLPEIFLYRVQYIKEYILVPALISKDEKVIRGLAYLFSEIGQAAPGLIGEGSKEALGLADAILSCVSFPSEYSDIADSTLPFWCCLANYILGLETKNGKRNAKLQLFQPVFSTLLDALLLRAQAGEDKYISDSFIYFRTNLEELLVDIIQILGPQNFIIKLFSGGWASFSSQTIPWNIIEARMLFLYLVADTVIQAGQPFDLSVVMHLVTILSNSKLEGQDGLLSLVYKTIAEVIGSYSKWLISILPHNLRQLLVFCASGIGQLDCSKACSSTLRKLCEEAFSIIHEPQNLEILFWIFEGLERKNLETEEEEEIIGAVTLALNSVPNKEIKKNYLAQLISPSYTAIQNLIDLNKDQIMLQDPGLYTLNLNHAIKGLSRMGAIFQNLTMQENDDTNKSLINIIWPLLEKLFLSSHMENSNLSSSACRSLSLAIHSSGQNFQLVLPKLLDCLSSNFLKFQNHDCYLRTAATGLKEFGNIQEFGQLYIKTFERFNSANSISSLNSSYICDQEPDLIEAYTNFTSTFITCCPKEVIGASGSLVEFSLQKAAICCTTMHSGSGLSAMSYISCLLDVCLNCMLENQEGLINGVMVQLISRCGEGIISNILYALLGVSALPRVHKSATILQQLAALCTLCERTAYKPLLSLDSLSLWLLSSVQQLPAEYLKQGEAVVMVPLWLKALESAAQDYLNCAAGTMDQQSGGVHMRGKGGRVLKRIVRDFAESHLRYSPPVN
ncbi:hypothetical protein LUZ60_007855 [Juncus effusus]|nr:hypothetical protein LUZ60_007855 [Juncus effusus]